MSFVSNEPVPPEGDPSSVLWIVGEAPGADELRLKRPFVGRSGQFLERYLNRAGLLRENVYLTNLCQHRPKGNKFKRAVSTPELTAGLHQLKTSLQQHRPNCILALGSWPLYYLTGCSGKSPGTGIGNYRGSILPGTGPADGLKVIPTYHPSFVIRPGGHTWKPVFYADLQRAVADSKFPDLNHPDFEMHIDPVDHSLLLELVERAKSADILGTDIETNPWCIGFYWEEDGNGIGLCITCESPHLHAYAQEIWTDPVPKSFQFGTYDVPYMMLKEHWPEPGGYYDGEGWDTYLAAANIRPGYPKRLDFLSSLATRQPYWKDERGSTDLRTRWEYNLKDCYVTYTVTKSQMKDLEMLYGT